MKIVFKMLVLFIAMLSSVSGKAQDGAQTKNEIIAKIKDKGQKMNVSFMGGDLQYVDYAVGNRAYYLPFSNCNIYYKAGNKDAFAVYGEIMSAYYVYINGYHPRGGAEQKPKLYIGAPTGDEFKTPQKTGAGQHFEGGSIYWSAKTGAHEVHGAIRDKWKALGWENSFLGFPTMDETSTPDGFGKFNAFEGGMIYFHPHLGTFAVPNMIVNVWKNAGWEKGKLGYPTSDEIIKNNNSIQLFEFGAVISTKGEPYKIIYNGNRKYRGLYNKWLETGGVNSYLGDLVTSNKNYPKNQFAFFAEFQKGFIYETQGFDMPYDAFVIKKGSIFDYYASKKWEQGYLGYPISDEYPDGDGVAQKFKGGTVYWTKARGAFEIKN